MPATPAIERVRFLIDDAYGLWEEGDCADYLGRESEHPDAPNVHLLRLADGGTITLTDPFGRGLVSRADASV